jgi:hypothetical protein
MEELSLHEIFSRPTYRTGYAGTKAENICLRCGGIAEEYRDTSSSPNIWSPLCVTDARTNVSA